ncbi:uncharacterized protein MKZ38_003935 [Zalerion maritima]|uniref:Uncharacterized protein n=1 Tax=Zalerion maritima TaxID=339359 RepID=A0AAD5WQB1_9PEZI|nr:uncharacterized protein MKZ38_003935 [Zalerion maritima]
MADEVENATAERALAELKPADEDVEMKDAPADQDADAEGEEDEDAEGEIDADGESDAEGEIDADGEPDNTALPAAAPEKLDQKTTDRLFDLVLFMQDYKEDDREIAGPFHKIVNRRLLPEYYEVIKEAVAFSTIRNRLTRKMYKSKAEFVRDCALIFHNAQVYNRPGSLIFKDAGHLREVYNTELQKLVDEGILIAQEAVLPDLGGLPSPEPTPPPEEKKEADEEDDDEEDEEDEDSEDERPKRGGRRKPRPSRGAKAEQDEEEDGHRKRGRPPKVLTPMEARIQALLKGVRRFKDDDGELQIRHFEKLPDSKAHPEYYEVVKTPVALDTIKKRAKRKKYKNLDEALQDMEVMFENAKKVNAEGTGVYNDAVELQKQARIITDQEKNKPDDDFRDEHGKLPLSAVEHKGETWKVGDWVHIVNPNDPSKPTVAQIYRIWQDANKQRWINACWYFHPYQTVHHVDKRFFENEVVKTGQYRDHMVQEIVDRCFVMFITRYNKGRPRGLPVDKTVYVCEARYNEDNCRFNKIKTWASCLPDEVREKDYEMDLFDMPRKLKKNPSPIKHLLNAEAKETDPLPRATYRRNEAPPLIGAVHKRPRDPNEMFKSALSQAQAGEM